MTNQQHLVIEAFVFGITAYSLYLFFLYIIVPHQTKKNEAKQEAKERAKADEIFSDDAARYMENRGYEDFAETEL